MTISAILDDACKKFPSKEALVSKHRRLTYLELNQMVNQLANSLIEKGVKKGDRVVILLRNTYAAVISYYAVVKR